MARKGLQTQAALAIDAGTEIGRRSRSLDAAVPAPTVASGTAGTRSAGHSASLDDWAANLPTKKTPTNTEKDLYEVAQTGPHNFKLTGGGEQIWADGLDAASGAALEAKFVVNPGRSPFIRGSKAPDFIREKIVGEVTDEFRRYAAVVADVENPILELTVFVNDRRAVPFFEGLMRRFKIPGQILVRP